MPATAPCPCGQTDARKRPLTYAQCCQPWHLGGAASTPEALMRSRYSAFVLGLVDYLGATWHPSTRPADLALEPGLQWLGLQVESARLLDDTHGEVGFVARSRLAGRGHRLQETSRFVREDGRWFYVDGDVA
jgi:SEC-C motif-containing protein